MKNLVLRTVPRRERPQVGSGLLHSHQVYLMALLVTSAAFKEGNKNVNQGLGNDCHCRKQALTN